MHIVLSGPYETLYTTAVDMWSFGCLCLNICIGKTAAVKQREVRMQYKAIMNSCMRGLLRIYSLLQEALLLLSTTNQHFEDLWIKTTKVCINT